MSYLESVLDNTQWYTVDEGYLITVVDNMPDFPTFVESGLPKNPETHRETIRLGTILRRRVTGSYS